jgi:hypothetical protein
MDAAFDKSWLGSLPRAKMEQLRDAHRVRDFACLLTPLFSHLAQQIIVRETEEINRMRRERALNAAR